MKTETNQSPRSNKYEITIIALFLVLIALVSFMIYLLMKDQKFKVGPLNKKDDEITTVTPTAISKIIISTPSSGAKLGGTLNLSASLPGSVTKVTIDIIDNSNQVIASKEISNTSKLAKQINELLLVDKLSVSDQVTLRVYNSDDPEQIATLPLTINKPTLSGRLVISSPLEQQHISSKVINLSGEMKGFFEGTLFVRIKNENGTVLYSDFVMPNMDNYEQFAPFSKMFDFSSVEQGLSENLTFEFYDISPKDGAETVLLSIPIILEDI